MAAVNENGSLIVTAGQMARQPGDLQATYRKLAKAIGEETPLFRFNKSADPEANPYPRSNSLEVFSSSDNPNRARMGVYSADRRTLIPANFIQSIIGLGGNSIVDIGGVEVEVDIEIHPELRAHIYGLDDGDTIDQTPIEGVPPFAYEGNRAVAAVPQYEIPPYVEEVVPRKTDLKVTAILEPTRGYEEDRIEVVRMDTGEVISGLIATGPIREAIGTRNGAKFEMTNAAIGETFEVLDALPVLDGKGQKIPVLDRNGNQAVDKAGNPRFQMRVVVRRTTGGKTTLDLSL